MYLLHKTKLTRQTNELAPNAILFWKCNQVTNLPKMRQMRDGLLQTHLLIINNKVINCCILKLKEPVMESAYIKQWNCKLRKYCAQLSQVVYITLWWKTGLTLLLNIISVFWVRFDSSIECGSWMVIFKILEIKKPVKFTASFIIYS